MALQDRVMKLRQAFLDEGRQPVPDSLQGVTKDKIRKVLTKIDRNNPEIVDAVFALLDNITPSWFTKIAKTAKISDGATTAHIGSHVGILQRGSTIKLDREGRDYWIKPLRELGAIEPIYLNPETCSFIPGHPVAKSSNSAYKLSEGFVAILQADDGEWENRLKDWASEDKIRQRAQLQATLATQSAKQVDTKHGDLIIASIDHYVPRFLPDYEVVYTDAKDGDRITDEEKALLREAGVEITLADAMPDVLLWNRSEDKLWVIEAVTSDGEVDQHKLDQLQALATRSGKNGIGFTTTYRNWKDASTRQGKHKNLAPTTYVWIQEDPSKHFYIESF